LECFAYAAAHDLKSPLRSINNLSQWIEEDSAEQLQDGSKRHLRRLRQQVQHMEKLLDDVLEYSRIDRKLDSSDVEIVDGTALAESITALVSPPDGFSLQFSEKLKYVRVCRTPLQQILTNLVQNAIKHNDKKTGDVQVNVEDSGAKLIFSVRDNGPGIDPEYHKKIFEMFETLEPRSQEGGTGMGLALVKKLITAHCGEITVESKPGQGACFSFDWQKVIEPSAGHA
jgi:signal transduction histidine kinase